MPSIGVWPAGERVVLVRRAVTARPRAVRHEPGPAGAEAGRAAGVELLLEGVEAAEGRVDRRGQVAGGRAAAARAHDLPEEGVVGVAAAVVADGRADGRGQRVEVGEHLLDVRVGPLGALERRVGLVDVGLVVLVVGIRIVAVDVRLQGVVVVGKGGELEGARSDSSCGFGAGGVRRPDVGDLPDGTHRTAWPFPGGGRIGARAYNRGRARRNADRHRCGS